MITQDLGKICKLPDQRKQLDKKNKKTFKDKNEKNLKRKLKMDQIQEAKNTKFFDHSRSVKAVSFTKLLIENQKTSKNPIAVL